MAFDWRGFLKVAEALETHAESGALGPAHAVYRTVIGRAYYAAFGFAHDYAVQWLRFAPKARTEERSQDHGRLRAHLRSRRRHAVSSGLGQLRDWRNWCDYDSNVGDGEIAKRAQDAITAAHYVIDGLPPPTS